MSDVLILTAGEYSGETIEGVFANREALTASLLRYRLRIHPDEDWRITPEPIEAAAFVALLDQAEVDPYVTWTARVRGEHVYRAINSGITYGGVKHGEEFDSHETISVYLYELRDTVADNILRESIL